MAPKNEAPEGVSDHQLSQLSGNARPPAARDCRGAGRRRFPRPRLNARGAVVGEAALPIRFRLAAAPPPPPPSFVPGGLFVCRYAAALVIGTMAIGTGVSEIKARTERA